MYILYLSLPFVHPILKKINPSNSYKSNFAWNFMIVWPCIVTDSLWIKPTDARWIPTWLVLLLYMFRAALKCHPTPGSKRFITTAKMYQSRCTAKNSWGWAKRLPETCRVVIPIKLEFSAHLLVLFTRNSLEMLHHQHFFSFFHNFQLLL